MDIFLSGSKDAIVMVEGGAQIVPEEEILEALFAGHDAIQPLLQIQEEIRQALGKPKRHVPLAELNHAVVSGSKSWPWPSCNRRWKFPKSSSATNASPK